MIDPYLILGLNQADNPSDEDVKRAARKLIKENHPDLFPAEMPQEERGRRAALFMHVKEAWDVLRTEEDRLAWAKGVTKKGVTPYLAELIREFTTVFVEMVQQDTEYDPRKKLMSRYETQKHQAISKKNKLENIKAALQKNIRKIKFDSEEDLLMKSLQNQVDQCSDEIQSTETAITSLIWKINYLKNRYEWNGTEETHSFFRTSLTSTWTM